MILKFGWGGRIRTYECRLQKPVPYRLATQKWPKIKKKKIENCKSNYKSVPRECQESVKKLTLDFNLCKVTM